MKWLVKVRHYVGGESIISAHSDEAEAQRKAGSWNAWLQTDTCYVEEFDPAKLQWPDPLKGE